MLTSYGSAVDAAFFYSPARPFLRAVLPMFFALSGFLVAGSLLRSKTKLEFMALRALRIYPALAVEVWLSALILGPILTTFTLKEYFTNTEFFWYLANVTGEIHYLLPGVFADNPHPNMVNAQLWTVPFELTCYVALFCIMFSGPKRTPILTLLAAILLPVAHAFLKFVRHNGTLPESPNTVPGILLVVCFLFGVTLYLYGRQIPWNRSLALISAALTVLFLSIPHGEYFAPLPAAYLTVYLGLMNPKEMGFMKGADYSYGVFLYGCVIQQALVAVAPWARHWAVNIAVALPLSILFAAFSWHFVEKPALSLKRFLRPVPPAPETSRESPATASETTLTS